MESLSYPRGAGLHAEPAVLPVPSEMGEAALDHALLISGPVEHLLAATDFTECSNRAVARGLERGNALGAQVTILHVVEEGLPRKLTKLCERKARELLTEQAKSLCPHAHNDISINVRTGEPYLEIVREAIELGSDAIILGLGEHGFVSNRAVATGLDVVRYGDKPVLLVARRPTGPYSRAVVGADPFVTPGSIMRAARRLAPQADLVDVVPTAAIGLGQSDLATASGDTADVLMDRVSRIGADLLVVGSDRAIQHDHDDPMSLLGQVSDARRCDLLFVRS
jgi:nucleotide-binding universal stress UspA family protein